MAFDKAITVPNAPDGSVPSKVPNPLFTAVARTFAVAFRRILSPTCGCPAGTTGFTVSVADCDPPLNVAVINGNAVMLTALEVTVKVGETVWPEGTITVAGTVAAPGRLVDRLTVTPSAGAGALKVTLPIELAKPPVTRVGFNARVWI